MKQKFKKLLASILIASAIAVTLLVPLARQALAATTDDVTVSATPSYIAISNSPETQDYGVIATSSDNDTAAAYFTITNTSTVVTNITIYGTNFTGGAGWTLSADGSVGADTAGMYAGITSGSFDVVVTASPGNTLKASLASSANQTWHLRLKAPSSFSDGAEKESTVTVSAAAA